MFCILILHIIMKHKTGYRGGMLNLYSVYSASNIRHLCALMCPAISFLQFHVLHFHVLHFHVRHFHVLQFHVLQVGPSFSRPAISCPAHWSANFMSCNFMSCKLVRQFHVRHFHVQHFQRPLACLGGDLSLILGGPGLRPPLSLPPSILLSSLPSRGLPRGSGQSPLTRCQTF